jgi:ADP-ribose pyrophosphatase YjhB (NUDIX family)
MSNVDAQSQKQPGINVDILVIRGDLILLGLMTERWNYQSKQVYGVPGRDIRFGETIGDAVRRDIRQEFDCDVLTQAIICVNANYALGNHYIGIGVIVAMDGEPQNRIPEDWERWEWFARDNPPSNLFPATANLIACYRQDLVNVAE